MEQILFNIFLWVWCFPQQLLGLILKLIYKCEKKYYGGMPIYHSKTMEGAISLGKYILVGRQCTPKIVLHEYGHYKQSLYLGWLYLIVIGLPSFIWCNCFEKYRQKHNIDYYAFYTEKWANKLVGM